MRRLNAGLAMTLDGIVDGPSEGGWLRWSPEIAAMIDEGLAGADAVLLGRVSYLDFAQLWPAMGSQVAMADFLNNSPKYVVSTTLPDDLPWGPATVLRGDLATEVRRLKEQPGGDIQVPGSPGLVRQLLRLGLLDGLSLMLHPIVLGTGRRLFQDGDTAQLTLASARHFANGVVALTYQAGPGVEAPRSAPF